MEVAGSTSLRGFGPGTALKGSLSPAVLPRPDVVVSMPCGLYAEEAAAETMRHRERLTALGARVIAVDAAAYFSRPGPRLVEGVELLGHLLHAELVPAPPTRRSIELDLTA